ncbi:SigE family RNA polymerase sigma factor [Nocardioides perillae]|uniref:RNA polymerase sigma-70 factor (Sigma-E family) n=1 Tax=Nocardioides perillae TaxID=1119534 RepID=A0A7Y9RUF7_9ACTN|nr:RNA polymerase sigma-70 factor (sigma-E family) [Nocardioides perillae]
MSRGAPAAGSSRVPPDGEHGSRGGGAAGSPGAPDRSGADQALVELYAAHWARLVRLAVLLVHDRTAAEDVVQDAFLATHARWDRLRDHDRAAAYLRQAVVNRARSELRHRGVVRRHEEREAAAPHPAAPGSDTSALDADRRAAVLDALRQLPGRQREVVVLRHYLQLSEAEVADTLGLSRGAVKSHTSRASARLRTILATYWEDQP